MKINVKSLGLSNINMNSLKKKQKQISGGSVPPSEEKIAEEPKVPEWKKNLISRNRTSKSFVQKAPTGKPGKYSLNVVSYKTCLSGCNLKKPNMLYILLEYGLTTLFTYRATEPGRYMEISNKKIKLFKALRRPHWVTIKSRRYEKIGRNKKSSYFFSFFTVSWWYQWMITSLTSNPAWWRKKLIHNRLTFYFRRASQAGDKSTAMG